MDTKHESTTPGAPPPYETRDANTGSLVRFGGVLVVTLVVAWTVSLWVLDYFKSAYPPGPPATPFEQARAVPPLPQLQVHPVADLQQYREDQAKALDSYGWVDRSRGTVHIPIERAMDLLLQRGLPTRPGGAAAAAGEQGSAK